VNGEYKDLEGGGRDPVESITPEFIWRYLGKPRKAAVSVDGNVDKIRTGDRSFIARPVCLVFHCRCLTDECRWRAANFCSNSNVA
jgi:hypothetical protein